MATLVKTPSGTWKAVIRKTGWPTSSKTFRTKRDAEDWSRRTEDEMVRGVYIERNSSERLTLESALKRYLAEVSPTKALKTQQGEQATARILLLVLLKGFHDQGFLIEVGIAIVDCIHRQIFMVEDATAHRKERSPLMSQRAIA